MINDILEIPVAFTIILDDYHAITEKSIQAILNFILDHQPAQMHLVISGRVDPPWPLARLRARGEIQELRSVDLRFTPAEAALFLNEGMGLHLTEVEPADNAVLELTGDPVFKTDSDLLGAPGKLTLTLTAARPGSDTRL